MPEDEWLTVVRAIAPGLAVGRDELSWVLEHLGRYVVQDGEAASPSTGSRTRASPNTCAQLTARA